jgi:5-methylcytosine-specific restriction endonuclease McrA
MRTIKVENVDPIQVFIRDGWKCQLCGVHTPRRYRGTCKPTAPELDHIVTLADGGEHSYRNTQCACRSCNNKKGSNSSGQMRLIA